ncbi:MAG: hypothetical protein U0N03_03270 [Lachnospiraceae bacterium]
MLEFLKRKKKTEQKNIEDQIALGINAGNLERHSDAGREFVKAFSGYDGTTGKQLQKSLSGIANGKPNMPGQRGYAAEVQDVAKRNAEEILKESGIRYSRVDDLPGHAVNETPFDIMAIDTKGNEIASLGTQMKFNQGNPADVVDTLVGKNFREKYPHAQYSVPADRYDAIKQAMADKASSLEEQLENARKKGNVQLAGTLEERLKYVKDAEKKLVKSKLTLAEAENAVLKPKVVTTKEVFQLGHDAGVQYAKSSAVIKGSMTFARCLNKVVNGEMTADEAAKKIAVETTKGAMIGYVTGQANTALSAVMRNSSREALRKLGGSSAPAQIVTFTTSLFKIVNDRMEGKISDEECFHNIAKSGIGVIGTFKAGAVGEMAGKTIGKKISETMGTFGGTMGAFGGPVGAIVGSVVAGVVIDATYDYAVKTLKEPGIARQERLQVERECEELHLQLEQYRGDFRNTYIAYTNELVETFGDSLRNMALAINMNDADSFIMSANTITKTLGGTTQFDTVDEFEAFLESNDAFDL